MHLVDRHKHWLQLIDIHQEVVDWEEDIVAHRAHCSNECHAVGTAQRMVGDDDWVAFLGDTLGVDQLNFDI